MKAHITWLTLLLMLLVGAAVARQQVSHVSINQRLFDLGKLPLLKMNVVAEPTAVERLQFLLRQRSGEEKLMVQQVSDYQLLLMGVDEVNDPGAILLVQEYGDNGEGWLEIGQLPLFAANVPVGNPPDPARFSLYRQLPAATASVPAASQATASAASKAAAPAVSAKSKASAQPTVVAKPVSQPSQSKAALVATSNSVPQTAPSHGEPPPREKPASKPSDSKLSATETAHLDGQTHRGQPDKARAVTQVNPAHGTEVAVAKANAAPVVASTTAPATAIPASENPAATRPAIAQRDAADAKAAVPSHANAEHAANHSANSAASGQCLLDYNGSETLWRLASRYAPQWHTHVYAAALAIVEANPKSFASGKAAGLRKDAKLNCPQPAQWQAYGDKTLAKSKFETLR